MPIAQTSRGTSGCQCTPGCFRPADPIAPDRALGRTRSRVRRSVWGAGLNPVTECGYVTLDFDATLLDAHSDKQYAAPTYRKGFGFHPIGAWLDNTSEALAGVLRPGNAGANTAADHIEVLDLALSQLPVAAELGIPRQVPNDGDGVVRSFIV
ncbi:MAG: hypothetical protein QOJ93_2886 [Actinomycetota bacterium]|nr:hypothetical protein [Actinomycetota bacterium]